MTVPDSELTVAERFDTLMVDEKIPGLAAKRRETYLKDAQRDGLDTASLEDALETAATEATGTRSVIAAVKPATVEGRKAWLVVQAWGDEGGTMSSVRAWLIDASSGEVISTVSRSL